MDFLIALAGCLFVGGVTVGWNLLRRSNDNAIEQQEISIHVWRTRQRLIDGSAMAILFTMLLLATMWGDYRA